MKRLLLVALLFVPVAACSSSNSPTAPSTPPSGTAADVTIAVQGDRGSNSYSPPTATVKVGQTVAWHNADSTAHTATQNGSGFNTGALSPGATSAPVTMNTAGTFTYHCTIHPGMVGTITVQ